MNDTQIEVFFNQAIQFTAGVQKKMNDNDSTKIEALA